MTPPASISRQPPHQRRRGSVIIFMLGVIFLAAFLLTRLIDRAGGELLAEAKATSRAPLRAEAYSVLETSLAVLSSLSSTDGGLHAPGQGWSNPLAYVAEVPSAGYTADVVIEDESRKLSLPKIDESVLQRYLETIGLPRADAERAVDALLAWTKSSYTAHTYDADPRQYESAPLPYAPPQRALRSWEELRAIRVTRELFFDEQGNWNELGQKLRADLSLHSFAATNVNAASPTALVALGLEASQSEVVERMRALQTTPFQRTVSEASTAWGTDLTALHASANVTCLRLLISVHQGGRNFHLDVVVSSGNAAASSQNASGTNNGSTTTSSSDSSSTTSKIETAPATRAWSRKSIDYPFVILELREDTGP